MAAKPTPPSLLLQAVRTLEECGGNQSAAAKALSIPRPTLQCRLDAAKIAGITTETSVPSDASRIRDLESQLREARQETLDAEYVKSKILHLSELEPKVPDWTIRPAKSYDPTGVPTLFCSDLHWGEIVDPNQIGGVNTFNMTIARDRIRTMVDVSCDLLFNHMKNPKYPGIVLALGGDMVTGDIHEELSATNEKEIMPVVLDLWSSLAWVIETLADKFGNVFVPCVSGNHGRNTHKIRSKGRNFTSFDWLLYQFLAKRFEADKRVQFQIPDGPDALYSIYSHRYLLTHGDQFRGGDGMIGALGPIIRGDHRKRSRNSQIDMGYDTMLLGHWHQLIQLQRLVVNGSLKGYCEYASNNNFPFEPPRQALWITHPTRGITFSAPVVLDRAAPAASGAQWVSWKDRKTVPLAA